LPAFIVVHSDFIIFSLLLASLWSAKRVSDFLRKAEF